MKGIKQELEKFYQENKITGLLMDMEESVALMNKKFVYPGICYHSKEIKRIINLNDIIFCFDNKIIFTKDMFLILEGVIDGLTYKGVKLGSYRIEEFLNIGGKPAGVLQMGKITLNGFKISEFTSWKNDFFNLSEKLKSVISNHQKKLLELEKTKNQKELEEFKREEQSRIHNLVISQNSILQVFDNNGDGQVDLEDGGDFNILLKKYQTQIIAIDRNYIQKFVKVSSFMKTKQRNIQLIFESLRNTSNQSELIEYVGILKNERHNYNLILFSSLNMITSLINEDMITFYEIHESFDRLNIFNSNWENDLTKKLINIGDGIDNLMYSIQEIGNNIISELSNLSYLTEDLNESVSIQLNEINSTLGVNNLLSTIQNYQLYNINNNTKLLRN